MATAVVGVVHLLGVDAGRRDLLGEDRALVLDREPQHVAVGDRVLDHVAVQAGVQLGSRVEHVGGRPAVLAAVRLEDGRAREPDVVRVAEVALDVAVHLAELAAMALVDDEHDLLVAIRVHQRLVSLALDGVRHLLDRRHDEFAVVLLQLPDQHGGRVGAVHAVLLERVVLVHGLVVQILAVDQEDDLVDARLVTQELRQLERRQRLARTRAREDIAVLVGIQHTALRGLHRVDLIRAHDHQNGLRGLDDHVLVQHLRDGRAAQELRREFVQLVDARVLVVRPEEHEALQNRVVRAAVHLVLIAEVLRLHGVRHHEQLQVAEQALERELAVAVNLVDCLVDLDAGALQLNLHHRKAVDENRHVIAVFVDDIVLVRLVHRDLMRHLIDVAVDVGAEEIQIYGLPVVQLQHVLVAQDLRGLVDAVVVDVDHHAPELGVREGRLALRLGQLLGVERRELPAKVGHDIVVVAQLDELVTDALEPIDEQVLDLVFGDMCHLFVSLPHLYFGARQCPKRKNTVSPARMAERRMVLLPFFHFGTFDYPVLTFLVPLKIIFASADTYIWWPAQHSSSWLFGLLLPSGIRTSAALP